MSLQERVDNDLKEAMKARQAERLGVLRMLKSALKYAAIEKHGADGSLDDADALAVVRKQVKQRHDAIAGFEKGERPDLADKERSELPFLDVYLPKALTPEEMAVLVREAIAETGATTKAQFGAVMKVAQGKAEGRVDGKTLSEEIKKALP